MMIQYLKTLIYKLGSEDGLNEIKIDLENQKNNNEGREKIIKSLMKNSGYIDELMRTFTEFISNST